MEKLTRVWLMARQFSAMVARQFVEDDCPSTAAALTYQTLFAVVPLLTVTYAMFNVFEAFEGQRGKLENFLFSNIVPENVDVVQEYLSGFSSQAQSLSVPSLVLLGVTAFLMLFTIERTFNEIWRVREPRQGYQRFLVYWALLTLGPLLIGIGFVISGYLVSLPFVSGVTRDFGLLQFVPFVLTASAFTLIYVAVPNCPVPPRKALVGGVLMAVVFEAAKYSFARIMTGTNFEVIYGTFAAVPLFLLWIYISWTIVLIGAEFVKGLTVFRYHGDSRLESPMVQLLLVLELFYEAQKKGVAVREKDIRTLADRIEVSEWNDLRARLIELNLVKTLDKGGIVLIRDLADVSVWEIYQRVPFDLPRTIGGDKPWERAFREKLTTIADRNANELNMSLKALFQSPPGPSLVDHEDTKDSEERKTG